MYLCYDVGYHEVPTSDVNIPESYMLINIQGREDYIGGSLPKILFRYA